MSKIGYKVLLDNEETNHLKSCSWLATEINYGIGKVSKPKEGDGPLAVFGNMADTEEFLRDNNAMQERIYIYKCRYEESTDIHLWRYENNRIHEMKSYELPDGTILADSVEHIRTYG